MEKQLSRENIYDGKVIKVVKDVVTIDDNSTSIREVVLHNGGVCIALKDKDNKFFVEKQFRYPFNDTLYEFPAGKIEKGEDPLEAIKREVVEETGYSAKNIKYYGYIAPTCGYSSEKIYLYYGEVDEYFGQHLDSDERIDLVKFSYDELKMMAKNNEIYDGKTIAVMHYLYLNDDEY